MGYHLGVDLGTTFSAAAAMSDGPPTMIGLGNRALQIPSVLYFLPDGVVLVGEAAEHRSGSDPSRTVREFKRRIGDPVPILVAGRPFSAQALSGRLLRWVVDKSAEQMGERPVDITLTYPANWGHFKIDLLRQVAMLADVDSVRACSEPEAAALQYASRSKVNVGDRIAVYDLGGGTFDVCVLEKTETGFQVPGRPEGIEHLGGIDFDEAIFQRVISQLPPDVIEAAMDDAAQMPALARLRRDCVEAKEALSTDVDAVIPVGLAGARTSIRLTRGEFEDIIRPALEDTLGATRRALRSADTEAAQLTAIVLVGGSSRIPLVAEMLGSEFRRPIAVDTHPKNDVAMGAARAGALQDAGIVLTAPSRRRSPAVASAAVASAPVASTAARAPAVIPPGPSAQPEPAPRSGPTGPREDLPPLVVPTAPGSSTDSVSSRVQPDVSDDETVSTARGTFGSDGTPRPAGPSDPPGPPAPVSGRSPSGSRRLRLALIAAGVVVLLVAVAIAVLALRGDRTVAGTASGPSVNNSTPATDGSTAAPSSGDGPTSDSSAVLSTAPTTLPALGAEFLPPSSAPLAANQLVAPRSVKGNLDLYLIDAEAGAVLKPLSTDPARDSGPILSPDRSSIVYLRIDGDNRELRVMAADGTGDRPLFATPPAGCVTPNRPAWNPIHTDLLAIQCVDAAGKSNLQIVRLDGQVLRVLDPGTSRFDDVAYSPDGRTLVLWGTDGEGGDGGSLYLVSDDGTSPPVQLTKQTVGSDADPMFSPDGQKVVFRRVVSEGGVNNVDIYVIKADGTDLRRLTDHPGHDQNPNFSPDGTEIVFKSDRTSTDALGPAHLWVMNSDGSDQRQLTPDDGSSDESGAAWGAR